MRDHLPDFLEAAVFRAEIVAPLADAVRLVHGQRGDVPILQPGQEIRQHQALRSDVEQLVFSGVDAIEPPPGLVAVEGGVDESGRHAAGFELVHLVLHQRDKRGDDERQSLADESRKLVAKAFPGTGREDRHGVPPGQRGFHDFPLQGTEPVVTESLLEAAGKQLLAHASFKE